MTTIYPLGVYFNNPNNASPATIASFDAETQAIATLFGAAPSLISVYIDHTLTINQWLQNTSAMASAAEQTPALDGTTPIIGLPLSSTAAGSLTPDQYYQNWASGDYDTMLQQMVAAWANRGFKTQYWRPGWEMNISSIPENYAGYKAAVQADWIAAFQHIYTVLHAAGAADGVNIQVIWNPDIVNYSVPGIPTQTLYPGNQYVDIIGADVYSDMYPYSLYDWAKNNGTYDPTLQQWAANPINLEHYYTYPAATEYSLDSSGHHAESLSSLLAFAVAQGKPVAICETGAGSVSQDHAGVSDNPTFVNWLAATLASSGAQVAFVNIWDSNVGGHYAFSYLANDKPLEAAAWANDFGVQGGSATISGEVVHEGGPSDPAAGSPEAGVEVLLLDSQGHLLADTTSAADGTYSFTGLPAGTFQIEYVPTANQAVAPGGSANATTGLTAAFMVGVGQTVTAPEGALISVSGLTGQVVMDGTGDYGVPVELLDATTSAVVATTTTDVNGDFSFLDLASGSYELSYSTSRGQTLAAGSEADPTTGLSQPITLPYGQTVAAATETLLPPADPATVAGAVLHFGPTDPVGGTPEAGVTVTLLDTSGDVLGITVSGADGSFAFADLPGGTYVVQYTAPANQAIEPGGLDNPANGQTPAVTVLAGGTVSVAAGELVTLGAVSGQVQVNGTPDGGVYVNLLAAATGTIAATVTTDGTGTFTFTGIAAGTYNLQYYPYLGQLAQTGGFANPANQTAAFTVGQGQTVALPTELLLTAATQGQIQATALHFGAPLDLVTGSPDTGIVVNLLDVATDTIIATQTMGTANTTGLLTFGALGAGTYELQYVLPANQEILTGTGVDPLSGLTAPIIVGTGQIIAGATADLISVSTVEGQVVLGGTGDAGVGVSLLSDGSLDATTTTDINGNFSFAELAAGTYQLQYAAPFDQILDPAGAADPGTGLTPAFTVGYGVVQPAATETLDINYATIDASVVLNGSAAEPGVAVSLLSSGTLVSAGVTDVNGDVSFGGLLAGTYQISFGAVSGTVRQTGGEANGAGVTQNFILAPGQTLTVPAENLLSNPASIQSSVQLYQIGTNAGWLGSDPNVSVALVQNGTILATTTSNGSSGWFKFGNIAAGSYQLLFTPPAGQAILPGSGINSVTGLTQIFNVAAGQNLAAPTGELVRLGSIAGQVVLGGTGESGVAVALLNAGATIATATTDSSGDFTFASLQAANYQLSYTAPAGQTVAGGEAGGPAGLSPVLKLGLGQTLVVATEMLTSAGPPVVVPPAAMVESTVLHFGGLTDPVYGGGDAGVVISLLNAASAVVATTTSDKNGWFGFRNVTAGTYQFQYTLPAGQAIRPTAGMAPASGLTAPFAVGAGQTVWGPGANTVSTILLNGEGQSASGTNGSYVVSGTASDSTLTLDAGNQVITLTGSGNVVTTGAGNQTITLIGAGNTIDVGVGTSLIKAGSGNDVVHAAGGTTTIDATGTGNLFDAGAGVGFLNGDGSGGNVYDLNAAGVTLATTIAGFNVASDTLDLARTLAGTGALADLSNITAYVSAAVAGANTRLSVDPTGSGGVGVQFGTLLGVHVTVAQLLAAQEITLA